MWKHVLSLQSLFGLQDDLKIWITSITASISEHEEINKQGQTNPTTSSTDEGTRREGSRAGGSERGEKSDRADVGSVRSDKGEKPEKKTGKKKWDTQKQWDRSQDFRNPGKCSDGIRNQEAKASLWTPFMSCCPAECGIRRRGGARSSRVSERPLVAAEDNSGAPCGPKSW